MNRKLIAVASLSFLSLPTWSVPALAAGRPGVKAEERTEKLKDERSKQKSDERAGDRVEDQVDPKSLAQLRGKDSESTLGDRLSAAKVTADAVGLHAKKADAAKVLGYAFDVPSENLAGKAATNLKVGGRLSSTALKAIDKLSPRAVAETLKSRGVGRDEAVAVLNRVERLKTDPSFLASEEAAAKAKPQLADRDQGLSETQLARNEDLADEVYGVR